MKNMIICGVARSGKTTLANMLREKTNCSIISTDDFIGSFHHTFPELEISHQDEFKTSEKLAPWLHQYFYRLNKNHNFNYVIEGYHMFPKDMEKFKHKNDFTILYLAYPKLSPKQIFDELRKHETKKDWTYGMPDKQLLNECELFSHISKMIETDCKKYKFTFYDVSFNRNTVLKEIVNTLIK